MTLFQNKLTGIEFVKGVYRRTGIKNTVEEQCSIKGVDILQREDLFISSLKLGIMSQTEIQR